MADSEAKLDIGRVLSNTFGVISRNPLVFLGLSFLIVGIPNALIQFFQGSSDLEATAFSSPGAVLGTATGSIVVMFFSILLQATLIVATVKDLNGQQFNLGDCVNKAVSKLLPLLGLGLLVSLGIVVGMIFLIVPGIILALMWMVATPVLMTEDLGVVDALKRSANLTSGSKWLLFLLFIIFAIAGAIIAAIGGLLSLFGSTGLIIVALLVNTITGALQGAGVASVYVDLRTQKEGTDTSALADVFS